MRAITAAGALMAATALSGCLGMGGGDAADVSRSAPVAETGTLAPRVPVLDAEQADGSTSALISDLIARRSVLGAGPLRDVSLTVLAANSRAAEASLRAARLRSAAKSHNWLPSLGPSVNLTSLGSLVTSLVLSQAILDNGARRAERAYAQADVEVAAIALAEDSNSRVHEALGLYLAAERATAQAAVIAGAQGQIDHYLWMMQERVDAGVNDRGDLQVVQQQRDELMATLASDRESAAVARAELQAMAAGPIDAIGGLSPVGDAGTARALTVMQAEAEGTRATAEAQVLRAGYLPGLSLGGDMSNGGLGLTVGAANGLGIGQGSAIEAAMAQAAAVEARITTEEETVARETAALQGRLDSLVRQEAEAQRIAAQAQANFDLFAEQQQSGQRSVPETMNVLQTLIEARRTAAGLQYDIVAARVAIAARLGVLVDGERM